MDPEEQRSNADRELLRSQIINISENCLIGIQKENQITHFSAYFRFTIIFYFKHTFYFVSFTYFENLYNNEV